MNFSTFDAQSTTFIEEWKTLERNFKPVAVPLTTSFAAFSAEQLTPIPTDSAMQVNVKSPY
jgi:hypothetical protein